MSGLSCGTSWTETYAGSQWHQGPGWINDALPGSVQLFMSTYIPSGFIPTQVDFLGAITQLTGTTFNALAAVPTTQLAPPYPVDLLIGGQPQRWFLVAGAFPGTTGTLQPNDYNAVTNQKFWVILGG